MSTDKYGRTPLIRKLVIRIGLNLLVNETSGNETSGKYFENSTKLTCLQIAGYRITHSTVLWLLEVKIRRGRKV